MPDTRSREGRKSHGTRAFVSNRKLACPALARASFSPEESLVDIVHRVSGARLGARRERVLALVKRVVRKTYDFEHEPDALHAVREALGALIDEAEREERRAA